MPAGPIKSDMPRKPEIDETRIYLGDWLKQFDVEVGEAARIAGCGQSYISNIIANRKNNINVLYLLRISEKLGITVNDLYRRLPSRSEMSAFESLSPKARATIIEQQRKKA